jgi:uncharacterized membrane protein
MKLHQYKLILVATGLIGVLLIASPAISGLVHLPGGAQFSELYLLGPQHLAQNYPFNVIEGQNYSVYVDASNQMSSSTYYLIETKLLNQTDLRPNDSNGKSSSAPPLYEYQFMIQNGKTWESSLNFSILDASISNLKSQVNTVQINGVSFNINKPSEWNSSTSTFGYQLLIELWTYNQSSNAILYDSRFVDLQLNLTTNNPQ